MTQTEAAAQKELKPTAPGEIRVASLGLVSSYVSYAKKLVAAGEPVITIRGTGRALRNVVETAEILKRAYKGMHQITTLDTQDNMADGTDEDGKDQRRSVCFLTITLTLDPSKIDTSVEGYQKPLTDEELSEVDAEKLLQALKATGMKRKSAGARKPKPFTPNAEHSKKK